MTRRLSLEAADARTHADLARAIQEVEDAVLELRRRRTTLEAVLTRLTSDARPSQDRGRDNE